MDVLVADITQEDPARRPTMPEVVKHFDQIRSPLREGTLRRRLAGRQEGAVSRLFFDIKHAVVLAGYIMRRLLAVPRPKAR